MVMKRYESKDFTPLMTYIDRIVGEGKFPLGAAGIADSSGIVAAGVHGTWPDGRKLEREHIFPLFSVTKPIVALAVIQLWEQGLLHLNEKVAGIIPGFGEKGKEKITIWHLLTHTSGLEQSALQQFLLKPDSGETDMNRVLRTAGMEFDAGRNKRYNSLSFSALGEIISIVSGMPYDLYMEKHIFSPLGMNNTSFYKEQLLDRPVVPVVNPLGMNVKGIFENKLPAGGLYSTLGDLLKLGQALLRHGCYENGRLISLAAHRAMTTPQTLGTGAFQTDDFNGMEVGLGWLLPVESRSMIDRTAYGHHGAGNSLFWVYPQQDLVFVFLTNYTGPAVGGMQWEYILNRLAACFRV